MYGRGVGPTASRSHPLTQHHTPLGHRRQRAEATAPGVEVGPGRPRIGALLSWRMCLWGSCRQCSRARSAISRGRAVRARLALARAVSENDPARAGPGSGSPHCRQASPARIAMIRALCSRSCSSSSNGGAAAAARARRSPSTRTVTPALAASRRAAMAVTASPSMPGCPHGPHSIRQSVRNPGRARTRHATSKLERARTKPRQSSGARKLSPNADWSPSMVKRSPFAAAARSAGAVVGTLGTLAPLSAV